MIFSIAATYIKKITSTSSEKIWLGVPSEISRSRAGSNITQPRSSLKHTFFQAHLKAELSRRFDEAERQVWQTKLNISEKGIFIVGAKSKLLGWIPFRSSRILSLAFWGNREVHQIIWHRYCENEPYDGSQYSPSCEKCIYRITWILVKHNLFQKWATE